MIISFYGCSNIVSIFLNLSERRLENLLVLHVPFSKKIISSNPEAIRTFYPEEFDCVSSTLPIVTNYLAV